MLIDYNYIGMGLPFYYWGAIFNLIQRYIFAQSLDVTLGYTGTLYNKTMYLD